MGRHLFGNRSNRCLNEELYCSLLAKMAAQGFDTSRMIRTFQP
jgi:hypothetical protein